MKAAVERPRFMPLPKSRNVFVALEGLSGTGKTVLGGTMAQALKGVLYKVPPPPFQNIRDAVDRVCKPTDRYFFYLSSVLYASTEIKELLYNTPVVCDRYILTTHCYHQALGVSSLVALDHLDFVQPDLTVLLTCSEPERKQRLRIRGASYNDEQEERLGVNEAFLRNYRSHNVFEVDNTEASVQQTTAAILEELHLRLGLRSLEST